MANPLKAAKKIFNKVADKGGDFIVKRVMLRPNIDIWRGEDAELKRHKLLARRERRKGEMNFMSTSDGQMIVKKPSK